MDDQDYETKNLIIVEIYQMPVKNENKRKKESPKLST